jgi:uncharacterized protein YcbX
MVVDSRSVFQTQRTIPKMALIRTAINGNQLTLSSPDAGSVVVNIPEDEPELRRSCRSVRISSDVSFNLQQIICHFPTNNQDIR